jgi:hypothetical protein
MPNREPPGITRSPATINPSPGIGPAAYKDGHANAITAGAVSCCADELQPSCADFLDFNVLRSPSHESMSSPKSHWADILDLCALPISSQRVYRKTIQSLFAPSWAFEPTAHTRHRPGCAPTNSKVYEVL